GGRIGRTTITLTATDGLSASSVSFDLFVDEPPNYQVIDLPLLPGADRGMALNLNERGQAVGWCSIGTTARAVAWDVNGSVPTVTALFNYNSVALGINNNGSIVGRNNPSGTTSGDTGFLYANGTITSIDNVYGTRCGVAINEGGNIAGGHLNTIFYQDGATQTLLTNVFYTPSFAGEQRNLALNNNGDVLGV